MKIKKYFFAIVAMSFFLTNCQHSAGNKALEEYRGEMAPHSTIAPHLTGAVPIIQAATSETATTFNVMVPRLKAKAYTAVVYPKGGVGPKSREELTDSRYIQATSTEYVSDMKGQVHWGVKKFFFDGLKKNTDYVLGVYENGYFFEHVDQREFHTIDMSQRRMRFAIGSCMTDSHLYRHVRETIWHQLAQQDIDMIVLTGDLVYVDTFDHVPREQGTDFDIWQRYVDSVRSIPYFRLRHLKPLLATWDDHDMVTNNSHVNTANKEKALRAFDAFFAGMPIPGVYEKGHDGVYSLYQARGQRFFLLDGRYFREEAAFSPKDGAVLNDGKAYRSPNGKQFAAMTEFGHWGEKQHRWLFERLGEKKMPSWLINGDQFFGKVLMVDRKSKDGGVTKRRINESLMGDHPRHFQKIIADLGTVVSPVAFVSGDIHFSEILRMEPELFGYETYEFTSSPIHSYMFGGKSDLWDNPRRVIGQRAHSLMIMDSTVLSDGEFQISARVMGAKGDTVFEKKNLRVKTSR